MEKTLRYIQMIIVLITGGCLLIDPAWAGARGSTISAFLRSSDGDASFEKQATDGIRLDAFIFKPNPNNRGPIVMGRGTWEDIDLDPQAVLALLHEQGKISGREDMIAEKKALEIEVLLKKTRLRLAREAIFADMVFDQAIVIEAGAYRAAAFDERDAVVTLNWHDFRNEDFLYITLKSVFMAHVMKQWFPDEDPAVRQLYVLVYGNVQDVLRLRDIDPDGAKKRVHAVISDYDDCARSDRGLYRFYKEAAAGRVVNASFVLPQVAMMIASDREKVYFASLRTRMQSLMYDKTGAPSNELIQLLSGRIESLRTKVHEKIYGAAREETGPVLRKETTVTDLIQRARQNAIERQRQQRRFEDLVSLADMKRIAPKKVPTVLLKTFSSFERFVEYHMITSEIVAARVRLPQPDGTEKFAHICMGADDNPETILGDHGRIFGMTLKHWRQQTWHVFGYANGTGAEDLERERARLGTISFSELARTVSDTEEIRQACKDTIRRLCRAVYGTDEKYSARHLSTLRTKIRFKPRSVANLREAKDALYEIEAWYIARYLKQRYPTLVAGVVAVDNLRYDTIALWPVVDNKEISLEESIQWLLPRSTTEEPVWYRSVHKMSLNDIRTYLLTMRNKGGVQTTLFDADPRQTLSAA